MTVEDAVLEKIRAMPPNQKQEVLDFVESLEAKEATPQARRSLYGILSDVDVKITEQDIAEARKEM